MTTVGAVIVSGPAHSVNLTALRKRALRSRRRAAVKSAERRACRLVDARQLAVALRARASRAATKADFFSARLVQKWEAARPMIRTLAHRQYPNVQAVAARKAKPGSNRTIRAPASLEQISTL